MFVNVEAKALARAMKIATAVVERRNTIPILSTVKLTYGAAGLTIEGTDLDISVKIAVDEIDGRGEFSTCINAHFLAAIVNAAGVAAMRIEPTTLKIPKGKGPADNGEFYESSGANITHGYASYEVETLPASDWLDISGDRAGRVERFTNGMFTAMLRKVAFCISTEETRYYLNGVCWQAQPEGKRLAATDGHRLALCRYADNDENASFSRIIPRKTVAFLLSHLDGLDIDVHQIVKGNAPADHMIDFIAPGIEVRSKLIDGTFPDVDRVIPKDNPHAFKLNRGEILDAIKQAQAVSSERGRAVRFHGHEGRLHVETKNPEFGNAKVKTSTAWPEGATSFGVNGRYAAEVIGSCQGEVTLSMADSGSPFLIKDDDKDMTRVVMPMRV